MLFYIILFFAILVSYTVVPKRKAGLVWLIILFVLSAFRADSVGTDTINYLNSTGQMVLDDSMLGKNVELIYASVVRLIANHHLSPRLLIIFMSFVTMFFLHKTLRKFDKSYFLGLLVYTIIFYLSTYNIARQLCACSIVMYSYTFLYQRSSKRYHFYICVILATLIHLSSIVYILLYFVLFVPERKLNKSVFCIIAICLFFINIVYPINISELIVKVSRGYITYSNLYADIAVTQSRSFMGIMTDLLKFIALIWIFIDGAESLLSHKDIFFYGVILAFIFSNNANADIARIFLPMLSYQVIYICELYGKNKLKRSSISLLYYIFVNLFFTLYSVSIGSGELIPYKLSF